ncbi:hypothetical protein HPX80_004631 [Salmonella enterica]|nr:hypothetical protein [Salmonella enterica]
MIMNRLYRMTENLSALAAMILLMTGVLLFSSRATAAGNVYSCGLGSDPLNAGIASTIQLHDVAFNEADTEKLRPGDVLYTSPEYSISYSCRNDSVYTSAPALERLNDVQGILGNLWSAGLGIAIIFNGTTWKVSSAGDSQYSPPIGPQYQQGTISGVFKFRIQLYVVRPITNPLRIDFNPTTAFKIIYDRGKSGTPGISIPASGWKLQYIPACIGKVTLPATVNMGRIITGGPEYTNKLVRQASFTITAKYNDSCSWSGAVTPPDLSAFDIKLNINFSPLDGDLGDNNTSILIKNGLKLRIQDPTSGYVQYNTPSPFYGLGGSTTFYSRTYTAWIRPVSNDSSTIKTGSFSIPVAVSLTYY